VVARHFESILVTPCGSVGSKLGLIEKTHHLLLILDVSSGFGPTPLVDEPMFLRIYCNSDGVILEGLVQRDPPNFVILALDLDIDGSAAFEQACTFVLGTMRGLDVLDFPFVGVGRQT